MRYLEQVERGIFDQAKQLADTSYDAATKMHHALGAFGDLEKLVTDRRASLEEFASALRELRSVFDTQRAQQMFMSRNLGTLYLPIQSMIADLAISLKNTSGDDAAHEAVLRAWNEAQHIRSSIDSVFAGLGFGDWQGMNELLNLRIPLDRAVAALRPEAEQKACQILLRNPVRFDQLPHVKANAQVLTLALTNVIRTAVQCSFNAKDIVVEAWAEGPYCGVRVKYVGIAPGMAGGESTAETQSTRPSDAVPGASGVGSGLSLAKQAIESQHGTLSTTTLKLSERSESYRTTLDVRLPVNLGHAM
jgi:hypothetical protein